MTPLAVTVPARPLSSRTSSTGGLKIGTYRPPAGILPHPEDPTVRACTGGPRPERERREFCAFSRSNDTVVTRRLLGLLPFVAPERVVTICQDRFVARCGCQPGSTVRHYGPSVSGCVVC